MPRRSHILLLGLCAGAVVFACSEGTVSAPQGGSILLEASPSAIGLGGQSQISALVRDQNGNPVRGDVEVLFFTDLGSIDRAARTDSRGIATATLTAGDTPGTATVRAVAGPNESTIGVPIGTQVGTLTLQASPESLPDSGGEIDLLAVVVDSNGEPLEGAAVTFSTELGTLESGGGPVDTDENGEARDQLTVTAADIDSWDESSFEVRAATPGPDGAELEDFADIEVPSSTPTAPTAQFTVERGAAGENSVQFRNQSTGQEPLSFEWDFENDGTFDSNAREPDHLYPNAGNFTVKLRVSNSVGDDEVTQQITVPVPAT